jgi:excisionase family DNA binding protein
MTFLENEAMQKKTCGERLESSMREAAKAREERLAYSMREAAKALGICERSVWQAIRDGHLKAAKLGRSVRIRREELERFLREAEA